MTTDHYLVIIMGDIEPEEEPIKYKDDCERNAAAIDHKRKYGNDDGIFKLNITNGIPKLNTYSNGFFEDALDGDDENGGEANSR